MKPLFSLVKGMVWGTGMLAHLCALTVVANTFYKTTPNPKEVKREIQAITGTIDKVAALSEGKIPDIDPAELTDPARVKKRQNQFIWRTVIWSLFMSLSVGTFVLSVSWFRVKSRGVWRYIFVSIFVVPFALSGVAGALVVAEKIPSALRPFAPTLQGLWHSAAEPLQYLTQLPVLLAFVLLPGWVAFARAKDINFARIFFRSDL